MKTRQRFVPLVILSLLVVAAVFVWQWLFAIAP
jgi:hypothetical protein